MTINEKLSTSNPSTQNQSEQNHIQTEANNPKGASNPSKYCDKKPYNNVPPDDNQELAPILVTRGILTDPELIKENMETWHIHGHNIPVAFAPIEKGSLDKWMTFFWSQVRTYIATGGTSEFLDENGHSDDLSYDKFLDDANDDEENNGFDPGQTDSFEDSVLLAMMIKDLIIEIKTINPKYGRILELLSQNRTKGQILDELHLGKSQGYQDIKNAQKMAKEMYHRG